MKTIGKYWKIILSLVLVLIAALVFFLVYAPGKKEYQTQQSQLQSTIADLQFTISENLRYADIQDQLPAATEEVNASRKALYEHFPVELREEDQIMYVLYLEELFGTEINFSFGTANSLRILSDGTVVNGLTLTVNYETTYQGFKDMIEYLATDSRITSIQYASVNYDSSTDRATGSLTLLCYVLKSDLLEYQKPDVTTPEIGKPNIFG